MARKLEVEIDASWLKSDRYYFKLPDGWDDKTPDEQQDTINAIAAEIIRNRVTITGKAVEVRP